MDDARRRLHLLRGDAVAPERELHPPMLSVVPRVLPVEAQQMLLPFEAIRPRTLIVLGYHSVDFEAFSMVLSRYRIRALVDLRLTASFHGRGFFLSRTLELLFERNVQYMHIPDASNPFLSRYADRDLAAVHYGEMLRARADIVQKIAAVIPKGPVLLMDWHRERHTPDRNQLFDALKQHEREFDWIALGQPPQENREQSHQSGVK